MVYKFNIIKGCCISCFDPSNKFNRFIALIFICLLSFGLYFCYDNPATLQDIFQNDLNITSSEFSLFYSILSWPNVVISFIGGFLIDRVFGLRLGTIIYLIITLIGQFLFAFGAMFNIYILMVISRLIFGIGVDSLLVAQNKYAALWFKGKEMNMVFGLLISVSRIGSTINFMVMEPIYNYITEFYKGYTALGLALLSGIISCFISLICGLLLGLMDKRAEKILHRNNDSKEERIKFSDIFKFKLSFWLVSSICVSYYTTIFPFISLGKVFFIEKWDFTPQQANTINSTIYIISIFASPIFGFVVDKIGNNINLLLLSIFTSIVAHLLLAFTMFNPYISVVLLGLSYSILASSLWPLVALIIPEYQLGTAYGIAMSIQSLGLAVVSLISGVIVDKGGYLYLEIIFVCLLIVALFCTILLWFYNKKTNGNLNKPRIIEEATKLTK